MFDFRPVPCVCIVFQLSLSYHLFQLLLEFLSLAKYFLFLLTQILQPILVLYLNLSELLARGL
jgi:hypothetical protein